MEGVLLVNKPVGPSSFNIVKKIRAISKTKRVGHAGTLDPLASGLLVVCLGRYTKLTSFLMNGDKVYETTFRLGETSTTDDGEGDIIFRSAVDHISRHEVEKNLARFVGVIEQMPPQFSAIQVNGRRAYDVARQGQVLHLAPRSIKIFSINLVRFDLPDITLRIHCSKGTYVRSLARDLGEILGVGAYAKSICRLASGSFTLENALNLHEITGDHINQHLLVGEKLICDQEKIAINEDECRRIRTGQALRQNIVLKKDFAFLVHEESLVAIIRKGLHGSEVARVF
jgi:tRNA pseudouridine55 synthase